MEWVTWVNTGVGIIGIVVGVIGWKALSVATKITIKAKENATVQQAQTINNGLSSMEVIALAEETTNKKIDEIIDVDDKEISNSMKYICIGSIIFGKGNMYEIDVPHMKVKILFFNTRKDHYYPNKVLCHIVSYDGKRMPLYVRNATIDIAPIKIIGGLYTMPNGELEKEIYVSGNQTVIGYLENQDIIFISVYKNGYFSFRIVAYGEKDNNNIEKS